MDFETVLSKSNVTTKTLHEIIDNLLAWGIRKQKVMKKHYDTLKKLQHLGEKLPKEWHEITVVTITAGELFIYPHRLKNI